MVNGDAVCKAYRQSGQCSQIAGIEQCKACLLHLLDKRRVAKLAWCYAVRPMFSDNSSNPVKFCLISDEPLIYRGWVGHHTQTQASRAAAIGHRLAHVDWNKAANGTIACHMFL